MITNTLKRFLILLLLILACVISEAQVRRGIVTSGGDQNSTVDEWRKKNIKKACDKLKNLGAKECKESYDKNALKKNIEDAVKELQCGDELVLYFNGHGSPDDGFVFDKEPHALKGGKSNPDRFLKMSELLDWMKGLNCCVKVYVGFHACYSGKFIEELKSDTHIVVAVSSSDDDAKSHKRIEYNKSFGERVTDGNWPDGFLDGLEPDGGLAEIFQKAAKNGKKRAEGGGFDDDPRDFKRGHVESVDGEKVTLKVGNSTVVVIIKKGTRATVTQTLTLDGVEVCYNIDVGGLATFDKSGNFTPSSVTVRKFGGKFHVYDISGLKRGKIKVHFVKPDKFFCKTSEVTLKEPYPKDIKFCQWYNFQAESDGKTINVSGLTPSEPEPYNFRGHVEEVDAANGVMVIDVFQPEHLKGKRKVKIKEGEPLPEWLKVCLMVGFKGVLKDDVITDASGFEVAEEVFYCHIARVDKDKGIVEIDEITKPDRYKGGRKIILFDDKSKITDKIVVCKRIQITGKCYGDTIKEPKNINVFSQADVGPKEIVSPPDGVGVHRAVSPGVIVKNYSMNALSFETVCKITDRNNVTVYEDRAAVRNIEPDAERLIEFRPWIPSAVGPNYKVRFRTRLDNDENPSNDTLSRIFSVVSSVHDSISPSVNITHPSQFDTVSNLVTISAAADDDLDPEPTVYFYIDNILLNTDSTRPYQYMWDASSYLPGSPHIIKVNVRDSSGNTGADSVFVIIRQIAQNSPPQLQQPSIMPDSGSVMTSFVYRVLYVDADGDAPSIYQVLIDNQPYNMNPTGNNFTEGVYFVFQRNNLYPGNHTYSFRFDDGHGHTVTSQTYTGPIVR